VEKIEDISIGLGTIPACDGQTSCHGIYAMHTRRAVKMTFNVSINDSSL